MTKLAAPIDPANTARSALQRLLSGTKRLDVIKEPVKGEMKYIAAGSRIPQKLPLKTAGLFDASTHAALSSMTPEEQAALAQRFEEDPHSLREIGQSTQLGSTLGALGGGGIGGLSGYALGGIANAGISGLLGKSHLGRQWPMLLGALLGGGGGAYLGSQLNKDKSRSEALLRENALANEESEVRKLLSQYYQSVRQGEPASGEPDEADARYANEVIKDKRLAPYRDKIEFPAPEEHEAIPRLKNEGEDQEKTSADYPAAAAAMKGLLGRKAVNVSEKELKDILAREYASSAGASMPKQTVQPTSGTPPVSTPPSAGSTPSTKKTRMPKKELEGAREVMKARTRPQTAMEANEEFAKSFGSRREAPVQQGAVSGSPEGGLPGKSTFWTPTRKLLAGAGAIGGGAYLANRAMSPQPSQNPYMAQYQQASPSGYPQGY